MKLYTKRVERCSECPAREGWWCLEAEEDMKRLVFARDDTIPD